MEQLSFMTLYQTITKTVLAILIHMKKVIIIAKFAQCIQIQKAIMQVKLYKRHSRLVLTTA